MKFAYFDYTTVLNFLFFSLQQQNPSKFHPAAPNTAVKQHDECNFVFDTKESLLQLRIKYGMNAAAVNVIFNMKLSSSHVDILDEDLSLKSRVASQ